MRRADIILAMLKIGLKEISEKDSPCLVVNGCTDKNSFVFKSAKSLLHAHVRNQKVAKTLVAGRVQDLEQYFASLTVPYEVEWNTYFHEVEIQLFCYYGSKYGKKERRIRFQLQPDWEQWARPYSIAEYAEALEHVVKCLAVLSVRYYEADELISNGFGIRCKMGDGNPIVIDEINRCAEVLKHVCEETEKLLAATARKNSVATFFAFPPTVKTACEQYLLYFVQFLEDLGIKADVELKEGARRVLFSVTPADGARALAQVRQALEIYLQLPGMPDFGAAASQYPNLAVQQLQGNILHLQSQLMLAKASLQAQEMTIEALQFSNFQYRQLLSSEERPKEQSEPLIGDTVHVTKVEGKGVKIDLPLILRRLKRVFGVGGKKVE
jgi:hypothetical protein